MFHKLNKQILSKGIRLIVILCAILLFGDSCKKHGSGYVEGTVLDELDNLPLVNAKVSLCEAFHSNSCFPLKETTTDENGHFKIKYRNRLQYTYDLAVNSDKSYTDYRIGITEKKSNYPIVLTTKAYLKLIITNKKAIHLNVNATASGMNGETVAAYVYSGQTVVFKSLLKIKVGHSTDILFHVYDLLSNSIQTNIDTTIQINKSLDTLLYSATIN